MKIPKHPKERIQKVLANAGIASRRTIETWIKEGRVRVNNVKAELGVAINDKDKIQIDGRVIRLNTSPVKTRVLLYHKPEGQICTRDDPEGRPTVFDRLPPLHNGRWVAIGRLDINTNGLLLFTNDGELANKMMHPSSVIEREYAIRTLGTITDEMARHLTHGVMLDDGEARFEHIMAVGGEGANRWYHAVVMEGRQRVVRRLIESQGLKVSRLTRVRFGQTVLPRSVTPGRWKEFSAQDVDALQAYKEKPPCPEQSKQVNKPKKVLRPKPKVKR
jgi:23S rRNA pseudouridine2605 synthase